MIFFACNRDLRCQLDLTERFVLRQRVVGNDNPIKLGRCFQFLNNWYGIQNGGDRKSDEKFFHLKAVDIPSTQKELAEKYGITQQTMNNYMRLAKAIPELEELVDTVEVRTMIENREKLLMNM